jgi:uncharacterized protein YjbI with pentapeptide repeats
MRSPAVALLLIPLAVFAQDMTSGVDLTSPDMTTAQFSRADVEAAIGKSHGAPLDLSGARLSGLDLSGLDLRGANLRAARLNHAHLAGARLDGANLDQVWALEADFSLASLVEAHLFQAQLARSNFDGADFRHARVAANFTGGSLRRANLRGAEGAADEKNQSMGLMRASFQSAHLEGADFTDADLARADLRYAHCDGADFADARLREADASGADLRGARFVGASTTGLDLDQADIDADASFPGAIHRETARAR